MTDPSAQVFLSYKSEDRARLKPLVEALQAEGFSVWWDAHIGGGSNWREAIEQNLEAAGCVIVAWTKRSVGAEGEFVRDEAARARRRGAYLPIRLDDVDPPLGFGEVQVLSLKGWKGDPADAKFRALAEAVDAALSGQRATAARKAVLAPKVSRRALVGGGVGTTAIAAAAAVGWALLKPSSAAASKRVAVMSFNNMSGDPAQAYFSDGIAEELRGALSRVGLQVIGRASCEAVKNLAIPEAAAKLGVAHILTGSVRRSPETIRIGAQLVNGHDGVEKWAQTYDRAPGDAIKLQTDIAAEVARALSVALGAAKKAVLTLGGTADAGAQDLYLQARTFARSADGPDVSRKLIALYDAAIARDPNYGDAHLGKASSLAVYGAGFAGSPAELTQWLDRADQSARRAAALMPGSGSVAAMFGSISALRLDFRGALQEFSQALASAPDDPSVLVTASDTLPWLVDGPSALALADHLLALDPLSPTAHSQRGLCLFALRRYQEAISACTRATALAPQRNFPKYYMSHSLILLGRSADAQALLAKMRPDDTFVQTDKAILSARRGDHVGATAILGRIRATDGDTSTFQYAQIHAQLGEIDEAFAALDKGVEVRDAGLRTVKRDPFLDPIRRDPRYIALLTRLNFP